MTEILLQPFLLPFAYKEGQISFACTTRVQVGMLPEYLTVCCVVRGPSQWFVDLARAAFGDCVLCGNEGSNACELFAVLVSGCLVNLSIGGV
jgi:hypothetical protein